MDEVLENGDRIASGWIVVPNKKLHFVLTPTLFQVFPPFWCGSV